MLKKILMTIFGALLGVLGAHLFNPFEWITIIPDGSSYDVCIAVYFTIADTVIDWIVNQVESKCLAEVYVAISRIGTAATIESDLVIDLDARGHADLCIKVNVQGKRKHFGDIRIVIPSIGFASIQPSFPGQGVSLDICTGNNVITLDSVLGRSETVDFSKEFRLAVVMTPSGNEQSELICPQIEGKPWNVCFKSNKATIRVR